MTTPPFSELDSEAARRALDYYLNPTPAMATTPDDSLVIARQDLTAQDAAEHAADLLRCAAASAYEAASNLKGSQRDLAFSVMHMINMARALLNRSLAEYNRINDAAQVKAPG
ncbi:DUF6124 family protein [Pseudomonas aegrilactucae]|uniref:DUF3077 domain-containing protein n=1 Tax=Pseudomonas aegrilactucae TaxID=2854028 RepID=A0A9Q2XJ42_9PSED|nr:DUF3077 domain-containing protein [Pseudomonas aegrilactucae]MBV6287051.1 DUF3077 domain-containing protein [Pseudomonas aegrilactucae]